MAWSTEISSLRSETGDPLEINLNEIEHLDIVQHKRDEEETNYKDNQQKQEETIGRNKRKEMSSESSPIESMHDSKETAPDEGHVCPECNFLFSTSENLGIHQENVHPQLELLSNRESV